MHHVTSTATLDHPDLQPYRTLRRQDDHRRRGLFVAEGRLVVERLLDSSLEVVSLLVTPRWLDRLQPYLDRRSKPARIFLAPEATLAAIIGYHAHQGVMALGRVPEPVSLGVLLESHVKPALLLALDGVANPENLGLMVRAAAAFGVTAVVVGETTADPWLRRAVRNSMGAIFQIPTVAVPDLATTLWDLQQVSGLRVLAACPRGGGPVWDAPLWQDCCLALGHEGEGLRPRVVAACTQRITIPMFPGPDSLNVAGAASVLLYEATRQRAEVLRARLITP